MDHIIRELDEIVQEEYGAQVHKILTDPTIKGYMLDLNSENIRDLFIRYKVPNISVQLKIENSTLEVIYLYKGAWIRPVVNWVKPENHRTIGHYEIFIECEKQGVPNPDCKRLEYPH